MAVSPVFADATPVGFSAGAAAPEPDVLLSEELPPL